jgi:DNA-binding beta-propeller fold protein YncE
VAVSPAGDKVFVTGFGTDDITPVDRSAVTIAYSSSGQQLWLSRHTTPGGEAMGKVIVSPDGQRAYVTGLAVGQSFGVGLGYIDVQAPATLAYDTASGAVVWSAHFPDQGQGRDAVVSPDSRRLFVAVGGSDATTVAYDA